MLRWLGKTILKLGGWTAVGELPDVPKAVFIAAPHTTYPDAFWALAYVAATGLEAKFFAKHTAFFFPVGNILRAFGGIDLDRDRAGTAVQQAVQMFEENETFYFGLAPEGTRKKTAGWKSGFYRIAMGAGVPVYLGFLDYGRRRLGIGPKIELTGDVEADMAVIRDFYKDVEGRWPDKASPVRLDTQAPRQNRPVRSFVRRAGRMTASQQRALESLWPAFGIEYAEQALVYDEVFDREAPVVLEIGFGNGETLVEQAAARADRDFIGVEVHEPGVGHCLLKAQEAGVRNLRLINHDAVEVLKNQVPPQSLSRLNLYFPDPWPKKRHHKRRIVQDEFVDLVAERLSDGGTLHIATDWADYATHIDETLARSGRFTLIERREHDGDAPLDRPQTKFERRGLRRGHGIVDWCFEKNDL